MDSRKVNDRTILEKALSDRNCFLDRYTGRSDVFLKDLKKYPEYTDRLITTLLSDNELFDRVYSSSRDLINLSIKAKEYAHISMRIISHIVSDPVAFARLIPDDETLNDTYLQRAFEDHEIIRNSASQERALAMVKGEAPFAERKVAPKDHILTIDAECYQADKIEHIFEYLNSRPDIECLLLKDLTLSDKDCQILANKISSLAHIVSIIFRNVTASDHGWKLLFESIMRNTNIWRNVCVQDSTLTKHAVEVIAKLSVSRCMSASLKYFKLENIFYDYDNDLEEDFKLAYSSTKINSFSENITVTQSYKPFFDLRKIDFKINPIESSRMIDLITTNSKAFKSAIADLDRYRLIALFKKLPIEQAHKLFLCILSNDEYCSKIFRNTFDNNVLIVHGLIEIAKQLPSLAPIILENIDVINEKHPRVFSTYTKDQVISDLRSIIDKAKPPQLLKFSILSHDHNNSNKDLNTSAESKDKKRKSVPK